jgi:hypothetical protein
MTYLIMEIRVRSWDDNHIAIEKCLKIMVIALHPIFLARGVRDRGFNVNKVYGKLERIDDQQ